MFDYTVTPYSKRSHRYSEDRYIVGSNYVLILDAESTQKPFASFPNDGVWFANFIKKHLKNYETDVLKKLVQIAQMAANEYTSLGGAIDGKYPMASIAVLEFDNKQIKLSYIGNVELAIIGKDGSIKRMRDQYFQNIDITANNMVKEAKKKTRIFDLIPYQMEAEKYAKAKYLEAIQKDEANIFTIGGVSKFIFKVQYFNPSDVKTIYMYTDGFADAYQVFNVYHDFVKMFRHKINIKKAINKIQRCVYMDTFCYRNPRYKIIDDITIVQIDVNY